MSLTYLNDTLGARPVDAPVAESADQEVFIPSYARSSKSRAGQKKVKTWMILAPLGGLLLIGGGAMMLMNDGATTAPLVEPAAPSVSAPTPMSVQPPVVAAPATAAAAPAPVEVAPAPQAAIRDRQPVRAPAATAQRAAPLERVAPTPRIETPAEPTGPRSYSASPSVTAPATPAPPAPAIAVQPLS